MKWIMQPTCAWFILLATVTFAPPVDAEQVRDRPRAWQAISYVEEAKLEGATVFVIDFEDDGTVWIAASDGLYRYDGYHWKRFTTDHGLPSNYVRCIRVTRGGELWVGTDRGVGVYDGAVFDPRGSEGQLAGPSVRRISEDPDGTLWFSCDQWPPSDVPAGLTRHRDGTWTSWDSRDGLPSDYVSDVFRDSAGEHYVLTRRGLARFDGDRLDSLVDEPGLEECQGYIWSMVETQDGELVIGTDDWFCIKSGENWRAIPNRSPRINLAQTIRTRDDLVLACTSASGGTFVQFENGRFVPVWKSPIGTTSGVQYIAEAPDGAIWLGGPDILARWDRQGSEWRSYDTLPLPNLRDREGGVWFADEERVVRLDEGRWTAFPEGSPPLALDSSRGVWMRSGRGMARWRPDGITRFSAEEIGVETPQRAGVDGAGSLWVAGTIPRGGSRFASFDGRIWTTHDTENIRAAERVVFQAPNASGGMWYVLHDPTTEFYRLLRVDGSGVKDVPLPTTAGRYWVPGVHEDRSRRLWLYGWMGLYLMNLDSVSADWWRVDELPGNQVRRIVELKDEVWFSYMGSTGGSGGHSRLRDGTWTHLPNVARMLTADAEQNKLLFSDLGSVTIYAADSVLRRIALPERLGIRSLVLGPQGELWVGTDGPVLHYQSDGTPPETVIDRAQRVIQHGEELVLQVRGVERFRLPNRSTSFSVAFQVDDEPWSELRPLEDGSVTVEDLTQGNHVVRVRLADPGGDLDPTPAEWHFRLRPVPLQDRAWFQPAVLVTLLTVLLLAGISVVARRRELTQRRKQQELEHQILGITEREQRRIGRDLHDSLGQRLTSISFQCESLRTMLERGESNSSDRAREIGASIRETISEAKVLAHALYPAEIDQGDLEAALGNLVASVAKGSNGTCTYLHRWSPPGLSREDSLDVYRMVQEALANAMRHAVAETIAVELRREQGKWIIEVRDDGRGFDSKHPAAGIGLQIMQYRAERIDGRLIIESRPGSGTTIRCEVPIK